MEVRQLESKQNNLVRELVFSFVVLVTAYYAIMESMQLYLMVIVHQL